MRTTKNLFLSSGFDIPDDLLEDDGSTLTKEGKEALAKFILKEVRVKR
jgi:hypothetical protein